MAETATLSGSVFSVLLGGFDQEATLSGRFTLPTPTLDEWDRLIDDPLIEWGKDPERYRDDGLEPPTRKAIASAAELVKDLRGACIPILPRLVMKGDGGIVFDWVVGDLTLSIEISADGHAERILFDGSRVVHRS